MYGAVKRKDLNIPEDAFVVGMVGRMSPQKAPDIFVKMAKKVKDPLLPEKAEMVLECSAGRRCCEWTTGIKLAAM